jgi:hypothetical protein
MRQEENQYLAVPKEAARFLSTDLQRLLGYDLAANHWGYVDQEHPMDFINGTEGQSLTPQATVCLVGRLLKLNSVELIQVTNILLKIKKHLKKCFLYFYRRRILFLYS